MSAAGFDRNPAEIATPSSEYRTGAGWGNGGWIGAWNHLKKTIAAHPDAEIVFFGDSISQGLTGHGDRVAKAGGERAIDKYYGNRKALSLGLSGDRTEHLIWRTLNGQFEGLEPDWVVVMIGVNNINSANHSGGEVAAGTRKLVAVLKKALPASKILLLGSFPPGKMPGDPRREETRILHEGIAPLADGGSVFYRDLRPLFLDGKGIHNGLMSRDGIHLNEAGKEAWMKALRDQLDNE